MTYRSRIEMSNVEREMVACESFMLLVVTLGQLMLVRLYNWCSVGELVPYLYIIEPIFIPVLKC